MTENGLPEGTIRNPEAVVAPEPEKVVPYSHFTATAHKSFEAGKAKGHEAGYQQALQELNQQHLNAGMQTQGQPQSGMAIPGGSVAPQANYVHKDELPQKLMEFQQQQVANYHGQRIYNEMEAKKTAARSEIPDYDQVVNSIDFTKIPEVYMLLNSADNAGHLMYEIAKDPKRLVDLRGLADQPLAAQTYVRQMADSVKQNSLAEKTKFPPEPIGQIKSNLTTADNGSQTSAQRKANKRYVW